jgi:hypothetical protein
MAWTFKAKQVVSLPLKPEDVITDCFSWVKIFHGENGAVFYCYEHEDWTYCPLKNINIDYCQYECSCSDCPEAKYFVLVNDEKIPVNKLT